MMSKVVCFENSNKLHLFISSGRNRKNFFQVNINSKVWNRVNFRDKAWRVKQYPSGHSVKPQLLFETGISQVYCDICTGNISSCQQKEYPPPPTQKPPFAVHRPFSRPFYLESHWVWNYQEGREEKTYVMQTKMADNNIIAEIINRRRIWKAYSLY